MANVFGKIERKGLKQDLVPLGILLAVPFVVVSIMFDSGNDTMTELMTIGTVGAALTLLLVFVYARINPRSFQRIFQPAAYERCLSMDKSVIGVLGQLDDTYHVFNNFIFELCGVEHLVVSKRGIFVISKVTHKGELRIKNNVLFADDKPLETLTGNTWRICHLVNIILKKWFKIDYLPQPVLVSFNNNPSTLCDYDRMAIVAPTELPVLIKERCRELDPEIAYGFANFIRDRYVTNK
ncbi:hypothetical protein [Desulforhopalus sp. IMCC35007]|uniref:hypothetical protein n=1 Tax=Desulforhopalus sp. IMCC35007 TaxID=2569543 RepID=UPI0010AE6D29|nr:hypothetical protein [Desulforhopalus sp. IMCC35007]TKB05846.1 hypothetical protein FCL48_23270 [Desulforhopalus sp. IMCC35007]